MIRKSFSAEGQKEHHSSNETQKEQADACSFCVILNLYIFHVICYNNAEIK